MNGTIRVVGIDWATQKNRRAAVELSTAGNRSRVEHIHAHLDDAQATKLLQDVTFDCIGVDTPFGWPKSFLEFASAWSPTDVPTKQVDSKKFALRTTDEFVEQKTGKRPLSVSSDRIALCSLSWMRLMISAGIRDRVDVGQTPTPIAPIIEVYPGATLIQLARTDAPKFKTNREKRHEVLRALMSRFSVETTNDHFELLVGPRDEGADSADAFLAALTALAWCGRLGDQGVHRPSEAQLGAATTEGWIFFPLGDAALSI